MPIVIKEMQVTTVVERKIIQPEEISEKTFEYLKNALREELFEKEASHRMEGGKRER